jgi:hypothetical protein
VAVAEAVADGRTDERVRADTERLLQSLIPEDGSWSAYSLIVWALHLPKGGSYSLDYVMPFVIPRVIRAGLASGGEVASLLHDILGPLPFRPAALAPAWLDWDGGLVRHLAQAAYDNRTMPAGTLDGDRLAVLADALEDAGCTDPDLLGHLRSPGPHVRGCWAVDLLLGKS